MRPVTHPDKRGHPGGQVDSQMHPRHPARPREREQRRPSWWRLTVTANPLGHSPGGRDLSLSLSTVVPGQVFTRGRQQIMCPVITGSLGAMPSKGPQSRSPLSFLVNQCDLFSPHFFFFLTKSEAQQPEPLSCGTSRTFMSTVVRSPTYSSRWRCASAWKRRTRREDRAEPRVHARF